MTAETSKAGGVHTCSYACERPECIRAQRDELAARLTAETSNAREWVLVPREPTQAMREAFNDWRPTEGNNYAGAQSFNAQERWAFRQRYAALLAAAPPPAAARVDVRGLVAKCRTEADAAYVAYIRKMDTDECRGWEAKVRAGTFARANLDAFTAAAELLGRHRALHAFASQLESALAAKHQEPKS